MTIYEYFENNQKVFFFKYLLFLLKRHLNQRFLLLKIITKLFINVGRIFKEKNK